MSESQPGWPYGPPPPMPPAMPPPNQPPNPPWGTTADGELTRSGLLAASVLGLLSLAVCPMLIVGMVLSSVGLDKVKKGDPEASGFLLGSWIVLGIGAAVGLLVVLGIAVSALLG